MADDRQPRTADLSAGFRPVDRRFLLAADAFQRVRFAAEILPLLAMGTDTVRRRDLLPFPAAEGGAEQAGARHDAPLVRGRVADGDIDAADPHRFLAHLEHDFPVGGFFDDRVPGAAPQHVGDIIEAPGPSAWSRGSHRRAECSTPRYIALCARSERSHGCRSSAAHSSAATSRRGSTTPLPCSLSRHSTSRRTARWVPAPTEQTRGSSTCTIAPIPTPRTRTGCTAFRSGLPRTTTRCGSISAASWRWDARARTSSRRASADSAMTSWRAASRSWRPTAASESG